MTGPYPPQQPEPFPQGPPGPPSQGQPGPPQYGPPQYGPPPGPPPYEQQPPPYGQPEYGPGPQYGQQQPPYEQQSTYAQQSPYAQQPYVQQPPQYGQQPPPYPPQPSKGGGGRGVVIGLVVGVVVLLLLCAGGIGSAWYFLSDRPEEGGEAGGDIAGVLDYRTSNPEWLPQDHKQPGEAIDYPMVPPAGGPHYQQWQRCLGDVYTAPIPNGQAVHSLEHGAVWITYLPDLPPSEVEKLAAKVRGKDFTMMSPYAGQPSKVSVQAWGYQLRLASADDDRLDQFLRKYRQTATLEPGAACSTGSTTTGGG